ncbi:MAG: methylated-DNA--[protein]-cysteine S-methyltransferase [Planctomycetota bacterium]
MTLTSSLMGTPLGEIAVLHGDRGLCGIGLDGQAGFARFDRWRRKYAPDEELRMGPPPAELVKQMREYFDRQRQAFDLPLDLRGTDFQRRVWRALQAIPQGQIRTYGDLARDLGQPTASRAIGGANGANPVPIVVPCHRVVAQRGLGGFSGPIEWKQSLLELEGVCLDMRAEVLTAASA